MANGGGTLTTSVSPTNYSIGNQTYGWSYPHTTSVKYYPYWVDNTPNLKPCIQHILDNEDLSNKDKILLIEALLKAV